METKPITITIETIGGLHTYDLYGEEAFSLVKDLSAKDILYVPDRSTNQIDVFATRNIIRISFPEHIAEQVKALV